MSNADTNIKHYNRRGIRRIVYENWYTPDNIIKIAGYARDGLTNKQIADNIGIGESTLYLWRSAHAELDDALKKTREIVDREVENALYKKALAGDVTAQIFWLKNRKPELWRDRQDIEHSGQVNSPISALTEAELRALAKEAAQAATESQNQAAGNVSLHAINSAADAKSS